MPASTTRSIRSAAATLAAALLISGCGVFGGDDSGGGPGGSGPKGAAESFLADWAAGKYPEAGRRTTEPTAASGALTDMQDTLRLGKREFDAGSLSGDCDSANGCRLQFDAALELAGLGEWRYESSLQVVRVQTAAGESEWKVRWAPSILHPRMTEQTAFSRLRSLPPRAAILDRNNTPLVRQEPVVRVGVRAGSVPDGAIEDIAEITNVNVDGLRIRTAQAEEGDLVEAVVLREAQFNAIRSKIEAVNGAVIVRDTLTLAPTRQFAREVLGTVGNATPNALANAGPAASDEDSVGLFGLQALYQKQLAGRASGRIDLIDVDSGEPVETLIEFVGVPGTPVHTTLDMRIQTAAEQAVALTDENSSLVAIDTTTGNVLAVASGPADKAGEDRALNGQYAPGTAFKMVGALALLQSGLTLRDQIGCPASVTIEGKKFENYDGLGNRGQLSLEQNFAQSCNTSFARRIADLDTDALADAAEAFGIGGNWDLLVNTFSGDVPPARDRLELANAAIGQGRVLMSPLAMAVVAAAIADGTPRYPRLVLDGKPPRTSPPANPAIVPQPGTVPSTSPPAPPSPSPTPEWFPAEDERPSLPPLPYASELRELLQVGASHGTAKPAHVRPTVGATTGTALYGSDTEPGRHAWLVGYNGNIAFAVIVERGTSGPATAGPLARAFLNAIL
ncbi:penicillin-binding transpeptidase domain-containing protein [Sporichthya brevicatena]|uniref:Penicillin-binding transpeptidase domain-containing protein n=1 Tax=Sporichthya brevicatena TaxID=171442 RepID=A0ABN1HC98_9ACTN